MFFLIPIVAGAAAWGWLNPNESGDHTAADGGRKIDCYQIWDQVSHGQGPQSIADGQAAAARLKQSYQGRLDTIDKLAGDMDAAWKGGAADAAQNAGAHPLRVWMQDSGTKLQDSDRYLGDQHSAFTTVAAAVQEVPQQPPQNNMLNEAWPFETDTDRAIKDYNTKGQANVDAFTSYFKVSNENGKGMPTYSAAQGEVDKVGLAPTKPDPGKVDPNKNSKMTWVPDHSKGGSQPGNPGGGNFNPGGGSFNPGGTGSVYNPAKVPAAGYTPTPGYTPPNTPGSSGYVPPTSSTGSSYTPPNYDGTSASSYKPPPVVPGADYSGGGFGPGGSGSSYTPGGAAGGSYSGGAGSYGGGSGFSPGGFGPGGSASFGPGGSGSSSGAANFGPGGGSGAGAAGAGAAGAGAAGAANAAGKAGTSGSSGMGGMGGARGGKGAGDEDRMSKFLLGDDPNDIFGTDELTAPPVIGE